MRATLPYKDTSCFLWDRLKSSTAKMRTMLGEVGVTLSIGKRFEPVSSSGYVCARKYLHDREPASTLRLIRAAKSLIAIDKNEGSFKLLKAILRLHTVIPNIFQLVAELYLKKEKKMWMSMLNVCALF